MSEIKTEESGVDAASSQPKKSAVQKRDVSLRHSRESLWGAVLFACMLIFVAASVSGIGWIVYSQWKIERVADSQPSISTLPEPSAVDEGASPEIESATIAEPETASPDTASMTASAQKLMISVFNGGGAKGSAGILVELLKKEGYLKTQPGNTIKNYTGVTVYYAANLEKEAESIKGSVAKKYPQAVISPADTKNKETSVSPITIIIGR